MFGLSCQKILYIKGWKMKKIIWLLLIIMPIILLGANTPSTGQNTNFGMAVESGARKDTERFTPTPKAPSKQTIKRNNERINMYKEVCPPGAPKKEIGPQKRLAPEKGITPSRTTP
jgi:hypothetical protein